MMLTRYGDLAVGAPYSGVDGAGTVFIFRGSRTGVRDEPDQVVITVIIVIFIIVIVIILSSS